MKKLRNVSMIVFVVILACFAFSVIAEDASLCIKTDRRTNISMGPGTGYAKSGVFPRQVYEYAGMSAMDEGGNLWHKVLNGESEMWLNAADSTVIYAGNEMPEEQLIVTNATVNLRVGPGAAHELAAVVEAGEQLICIGEYQPFSDGDVWFMVSLDSGVAWLNSRYAAPVAE